jgi:co-chaperonin GroES (HSP10)
MTGNYMLVRPRGKPKTGSIVLPEQYEDDFLLAEIMAIGPGIHLQTDGAFLPTELSVGNIVLIHKAELYEHRVIEWEGEKLVLIRETSVAAVRVEDF